MGFTCPAMPTAKCYVCQKTAYPLESQTAGGNTFHKLCFKCSGCKVTLNVTTFKAHEGAVYCAQCVPKASATAVADDFKVKTALNAPKRVAEGLSGVQKGSGDKAVGVGLDSVAVSTAVNAPKKKAEGLNQVQKGSGDKAVGVGLDSVAVSNATNAPKAKAEALGTVHKGDSSTAPQSADEYAGATYGDDGEEEAAPEEAAPEEEEYYDE